MEAAYRSEEEFVLKTRKSSVLVGEQQPSFRGDSSDEEEGVGGPRLALAPFTDAYFSSPYCQHVRGFMQPHQQHQHQQQPRPSEHSAQAQKATKRLRPSATSTVVATPPVVRPPQESMVNTLSRVALSRIDRAMELFLEEDMVTVTGTLNGYRMIRATHGCLNFGAYYFEAEILPPITENAHVRIGWATRKANLAAYVGFDQYGFGYRDEMGSKVHQAVRIDNYGESFGPGDVIGCFIYLGLGDEPETINQIRFFKNGQDQGPAFQGYELERDVYYPAVSLFNGARVRVNFGPTFIYGSIHKSLGLHPNPMSEMFPLSPEMRKEHEAQIAQVRQEKGINTQSDEDYTLPEVSVVLTTHKYFPEGLKFQDHDEERYYKLFTREAQDNLLETVQPAAVEVEADPAAEVEVEADGGGGGESRSRRQPPVRSPQPPARPKLKPEEKAAMVEGSYVIIFSRISPFFDRVGLIIPDQGWRGGWRTVLFDDGATQRFRPSELRPHPPPEHAITSKVASSSSHREEDEQESKSDDNSAEDEEPDPRREPTSESNDATEGGELTTPVDVSGGGDVAPMEIADDNKPNSPANSGEDEL